VRDRPPSRQLQGRQRLQRERQRRLLHTFAQQRVMLSECAVAKSARWRCQSHCWEPTLLLALQRHQA
jgi:hypothetical protein